MINEKINLRPEDASVTLETYVATDIDHEKRSAILVLPGGGYNMCAHYEGEKIALQYFAAGINAFVLKYSVKGNNPDMKYPMPLVDASNAMKYIKDNAERIHGQCNSTTFTGPPMLGAIEAVCPALSCSRLTIGQHYRRLLRNNPRRGIDSDPGRSRAHEIYLEREIRIIVILRLRKIKHLERLHCRHRGIEGLAGKQAVSLPVYMTGSFCRIHITYGICKEIGM